MAEQISFFNATNLPPDVAAKLKALSQQEQIANAMLAKGMAPVTPVPTKGELAVPISPFQGAASLVNAYFGAKGNEDVSKGFEEAARSYQTGSQAALEDYLNTRTGAPAHGPVEGAASPSASTPPQPFQAAARAAGSVYPTVHQLGMADLQTQLKAGLTPEDILKLGGFSPESKVAAALLARKGYGTPERALEGEKKYTTVGDKVYEQGQFEKPVADARKRAIIDPATGQAKTYWIKGADGKAEPYWIEEGTMIPHKMDTAPKQTVTVGQEKAASARAGVVQVDAIAESAKAAQSAEKALNTAYRTLEALDTGNSIQGFAATPRLIWNRIADTIGATGASEQERLANTQQLIQSQAQAELDASYQMQKQGQITEAERALLRRTAEGDFGMTATEIRARTQIVAKVARWRVEQHRSLLAKFKHGNPSVNTDMWEMDLPPEYRKEDAMAPFRQAPGAPPGSASEKLRKYEQFEVK